MTQRVAKIEHHKNVFMFKSRAKTNIEWTIQSCKSWSQETWAWEKKNPNGQKWGLLCLRKTKEKKNESWSLILNRKEIILTKMRMVNGK